jgi:hypothetical protein
VLDPHPAMGTFMDMGTERAGTLGHHRREIRCRLGHGMICGGRTAKPPGSGSTHACGRLAEWVVGLAEKAVSIP